MQECFPREIHAAYIIKPEKFWEKQKTSVGSSKYKFEVCIRDPFELLQLLILEDSFEAKVPLTRR